MERRGPISIVYRWRARDPFRKKWFKTHAMTDEDAAEHFRRAGITEFKKDETSREEREGYGIMPSGRQQRKPGIPF